MTDPKGTITGRWTDNRPRFTEIKRQDKSAWPSAYMSGPRKLSEAAPTSDAQRALVNADFSKLEERIAAWHKDLMP